MGRQHKERVLEALRSGIGRASLVYDWLREGLLSCRATVNVPADPDARLDKTGRVATEARPSVLLWNDGNILFAEYDSFSHAFWRAQELSLYAEHRRELLRPLLDFGCGDGSFASVLFESVDFGVDVDPVALERAREFKLYSRLIAWENGGVPLAAESVRTIFSNSVLEHVVDLAAVISELHRVLRPGGNLVFTVPTPGYTEHLTKYFGSRSAEKVNRQSFHRNLLEEHQWRELLERQGFTVKLVRHYQPGWFTFWYRMFRLLGARPRGVFFPWLRRAVWGTFGGRLVDWVRESLVGPERGANIFVMATRTTNLGQSRAP